MSETTEVGFVPAARSLPWSGIEARPDLSPTDGTLSRTEPRRRECVACAGGLLVRRLVSKLICKLVSKCGEHIGLGDGL